MKQQENGQKLSNLNISLQSSQKQINPHFLLTDYNIFNIADDINKMLLAKSLYNNKKTRSLKVKGQSPGPGHYNPIMDTFDLKWKINKYKGEDAVFQSIVPRFKKKKGLEVPGPGKYFKDEYYIDYNDKNKPKTMSYFFKNPSKKKVDLLQKYDIKTKQEKEERRK